MTTTPTQTPAETFRSAVAEAGFTVIDGQPDDPTEEQLIAVLEGLLQKMRATKV